MSSKPMKGSGEKRKITVSSIDLAAFTQPYTAKLGGFVMLKVDIEGAEFHVLRSLVASGEACKIDILFVEWHHNKIDFVKERIPRGIAHSLMWLLKAPGCRLKKVINLDPLDRYLDAKTCKDRLNP